MSGFLLDTNVISEFVRSDKKPHPRVRAWLEAADTNSLYASVLTFGEIRKGIEKLPPGNRRNVLEQWLENEFQEWFANRLLVINKAIANRWGFLTAVARRRGIALAAVDGLLCATALEHDLTVVTRNIGDFAHAGVVVLDPWSS